MNPHLKPGDLRFRIDREDLYVLCFHTKNMMLAQCNELQDLSAIVLLQEVHGHGNRWRVLTNRGIRYMSGSTILSATESVP